MDRNGQRTITCPNCGRVHRSIRISFRERALCTQCGTQLHVNRPNRDAALAFTLTALILAIPALELPLVVVRKYGAEHASYLWTGIQALWRDGFSLL